MKAFQNIVGIGENAGNQHFLLLPQCVPPFPNQISVSEPHLFCRLQMLLIWTSVQFCGLVELNSVVLKDCHHQMTKSFGWSKLKTSVHKIKCDSKIRV